MSTAVVSRPAPNILERRQLERELSRLAETAVREHELCLQAGVEMVQHAIRAGEALAQAKLRVEPGKWMAWLDAHFPKAQVTANLYMRAAHYKEDIALETSLNAVRKMLAGREPTCKARARAPHAQRILELAESGMQKPEIAKELGLTYDTVRKQLYTPEQRKANSQATWERKRMRTLKERDQNEREERESRNAVMASIGGDVQSAYVVIRAAVVGLEDLVAVSPDCEAITLALKQMLAAEESFVREATRNG